MARSTPALGVGVHLNLSDGKPVSPPGSGSQLLNEQGDFAGGPETFMLRIARTQSEPQGSGNRMGPQIQKVVRCRNPSHALDGHKHVHMLPGLFEIALRLAGATASAPIRVAHETSTLRAALSCGEQQNSR